MNRVTNLLSIEYPILQGAMNGVAYWQLVSAVSEAGGLGVLATAGMSEDKVREQVKKIKENTDKPFAVNIMLMGDNAEDVIRVIESEKVPVATTGAGNAAPYIDRLHEAGAKVVCVVGNGKQAKKMEEAGADAVVVEGTEAGGHVGSVTTLALVPEVAEMIDIPLIAAGGIADGRGLVAAIALGAEGVQLGTRFVASDEAPVAEAYKEKIVEAKSSDTQIIGTQTGAPTRLYLNEGAQYLDELDEQQLNRAEYEKENTKRLIKGVKGDVEQGTVTIGQVSGVIHDIKPVKEIIQDIMAEAQEVLKGLSLN